MFAGVPAVVQPDWWHLESAGMKVQSLAQHSGLRIWHCHSCGLGRNCCSDLIPVPGTPCASGWPKMKKQKHNEIKNRKSEGKKINETKDFFEILSESAREIAS